MKEIYAWVPWFQELARKIDKGGEADLIEKAKRVDWGKDDSALLQYDDENIDPFSFFYFLGHCLGIKDGKEICESVGKIFGIDSQNPFSERNLKKGSIFYTLGYSTVLLFHDGGNGNPGLLWKLFRQAVQFDININADDFAQILKIKHVGVARLTQCLFLINPDYFIPINKVTLAFHGAHDFPAYKDVKKRIEQPNGWEYYKDTMLKGFRVAFPDCAVYEINTALYLMGRWEKENITIGKNFFQVSTNVDGDDVNHWEQFSKENHVRTGGKGSGQSFEYEGDGKYGLDKAQKGDIILVRTGQKNGRGIGVVYNNDYADKDRGFTKKSKIHVLWLNKSKAKFEKFTTRRDGFSEVSSDDETYKAFETADSYHPTFALIKYISGKPDEKSPNEDNLMKHPLNHILYGPPGTGKTWNTVNYALAIIEGKPVKEFENKDRKALKKRFDKLKDAGQIEMVTFHQNFAYEDFIEGIRPILGDDSGDESSNLQYEIVDGVFKQIAYRAHENLLQSKSDSTGIDLDALLESYAEHIEQKLEDGKVIKLHRRGNKLDYAIIKINRRTDKSFKSIDYRESALSVDGDKLLPFEAMLAANATMHIGRNLSLAECLRQAYWDGGSFVEQKGKRNETAQAAAFYGFKMNSEDEMWVAPSHPQMKTLLKNSRYSEIDLTKYFRSLTGVKTAFDNNGRTGRITCGGISRSAIAIPCKIFHEAGFYPPTPEYADYYDNTTTSTLAPQEIIRLARQIIERDYKKFLNIEIKSHRDIGAWRQGAKKHAESKHYFALYKKIQKFHETWCPDEQPSNQPADKRRNYVLIIDEINRGNIAKIFGELITLIEDTKRIGNEDETTVTLPYSSNNDDENEAFGVPNNLYILGTMNTADRSIALLDTALRRRFSFIEMMPQANHSLISKNVEGVNCQKLLEVMNQRISVLLNREHQIGHSYFINVNSMEKLSRVFRNRIMPLLQEYFYDDWEKIILVLHKNPFIIKTEMEKGLLKNNELVDAERKIYELRPANAKEWEEAESYQKIYAIKQTEEDSKEDDKDDGE